MNGKEKDYKVARTADGLLEHLCIQMELVAAERIMLDEAKTQSDLVKQANNVLRYQLDVEKFNVKNNNG